MRARDTLGLTLALGGLAVGTAIFALPDSAQAHGAFTYPASRTYACFDDATGGTGGGALAPTNAACADALAEGGDYAFWNWYGNLISDSDGQHRDHVPDGELCGPSPDFAAFNAPREDWPTTELTAGETVEFRHNAWAPHPGTFFTYVTTDGYDTSTALNWDDLELIDEFVAPPPRIVGDAGAEYYWDVDLPDRDGRHLVYVVWERSDSPEAFYNCSDVVFGEDPGGTDPGPGPDPSPDPTPEPTPGPDPTDPPEGEYCTADYTVVSQWDDGFQAEVEVIAGEDGVSGWMVDWVFANRQEITSIWNASVVNHGAHFEASNAAHNGTLAAGDSTSFGFTATFEGANIEPRVECQQD